MGKVHGAFSSCFGHGKNNETELRVLKEGVELGKALGYSSSLNVSCC